MKIEGCNFTSNSVGQPHCFVGWVKGSFPPSLAKFDVLVSVLYWLLVTLLLFVLRTDVLMYISLCA